jgi:hypothetical protein
MDARDKNGNAWTIDTLHEHLLSIIESDRRIMDERDRLYGVQFKASETAVSAALAAQEKQTSASFIASDKAIIKAEEAQREYNIRSNEFRGQLDDQAKMLIPRSEASALLKAVEEKVYSTKSELEGRLNAFIASSEKNHDSAMKEIAGLRESRSSGQGLREGTKDVWGYLVAAGGLVLAAAAMAVAFLKG